MSGLEIVACGTGVTVQDEGRFGVDALGLTTGGAVDPMAWRAGQGLLDNDASAAALEIPLGGLRVRVGETRRMAVTGAPLSVTVAGSAMTMNRSFWVPAGAIVELGRPERGVYSYLSIEGGIATEPLFGSRTTIVREGLGGLAGRSLRPGDQLPLGPGNTAPCRWTSARQAIDQDTLALRFLPCFQFDDMVRSAREALTQGVFRVSARGDRMGMRLDGPTVSTGISQLWSEGTCLGAIQLPPDGQPIVLLNDRQTMGGYPKAGAVLAVDCARLAQLRPGASVRFTAIDARQADRIRWLQNNYEQERVFAPLPAP